MEIKNCPVCAAPLSGSCVCARCGYVLCADYTLLRSLTRPSDADGELLLLRRENSRQRLEIEELRVGPGAVEEPTEASSLLRPINSFY